MKVIVSSSGFTLIELMVGILIFTIGMTGIFALIQMAITASSQVRNEVIIANILREEVELVKNIRDTNLRNFLPWDSALVGSTAGTLQPGYYIIENNFSSSDIHVNPTTGEIQSSPVYLASVILNSTESLASRFKKTRLYLDSYGRYTHAETASGTTFASYIQITPLDVPSIGPILQGGKNQAYKITAYAIVSLPRYREYELNTIITDWRK